MKLHSKIFPRIKKGSPCKECFEEAWRCNQVPHGLTTTVHSQVLQVCIRWFQEVWSSEQSIASRSGNQPGWRHPVDDDMSHCCRQWRLRVRVTLALRVNGILNEREGVDFIFLLRSGIRQICFCILTLPTLNIPLDIFFKPSACARVKIEKKGEFELSGACDSENWPKRLWFFL